MQLERALLRILKTTAIAFGLSPVLARSGFARLDRNTDEKTRRLAVNDNDTRAP